MTITVRRGAAMIGAVTVITVLAACSSGSSSHSSAPSTTPRTSGGSSAPSNMQTSAAAGGGTVQVCSLLSSAQASALNKITYGAATPRHLMDGWDECNYKNNGGADPADIYPLNVAVLTVADCYDQLKSTTGHTGGTPVSGVGDKAWGYGIGLLVQSGSRCVEVEGMTHAELSGDYSHDVSIAKLVLSRLQ